MPADKEVAVREPRLLTSLPVHVRTGLLAFAAVCLAVLPTSQALARPLDLHLERLATQTNDPTGRVKNGNYDHLMRELGLALGPRMIGPAASLGSLGIEAAYEYSSSGANASADYWHKAVDTPTSSLQTHSVHVRKGLPWSMQIGTSLTTLQNSNMMALGVDFNIAVIDGFKHLPDVSIGGAVRGILGMPANSSIDFAVAGWSGTVSKSFGIAGLFSLQPWVSYSGTWTYVNTHQITVAPHAGALNGNELTLFDKVSEVGHRGAIGLRFIVARVQFGGEFMRSFSEDLNLVTAKVGVAF
jgi:hypothetical protein